MNELVEARPFLLMDAADEKQIIAEMRGEIIKEYVYSYRDKGRVVEGLSLAGINAVSIHMAETCHPMRVMEQHITEDGQFIKVVIKVGRYSVKDDGTEVGLDSTYGAKRQAKFYASGKENPFAFEQAISKAERNARRKLIPEKIVVELMKQYKNEGKVKEIKAEDAEFEVQKVNPEAITPEQIDELKKLALEIGYKNPSFGIYKTQADFEAVKRKFKRYKERISQIDTLREERFVQPEFIEKYKDVKWERLFEIKLERLRDIIEDLEQQPLANEPEKVPLKKLTKAEKIELIKEKIKQLDWNEDSPEVTKMLQSYDKGIFNVSQLVSLDGKTLDKILREEFGGE